MHGAIVSPFKSVRTILRNLINSMDPEITITEETSASEIEAMIRDHGPAFILLSLPPMTDGGMQRAGRIKACFPDIPLAVMVRYDYPEYEEISTALGIDYLISEEKIDRQIIQHLLNHVKTR